MKLHVLKIKNEYLVEIFCGRKTFELRRDDRDYKVGDLIHFVDINGDEVDTKEFNKGNLYEITYILRNVPEYGLQDGFAILSINQVI